MSRYSPVTKISNLGIENIDGLQDALNNVNTGGGFSWSSKKANFMGDSITDSYPSTDKSIAWPAQLGNLLGLDTVRNYGVPGTLLSGNPSDSSAMVNRILDMDTDADIIFLFGGGNDMENHVPIGDKFTLDGSGNMVPNTTTTTFYGALHVSCQRLIQRYPTKRIILCTMIHSFGEYNKNNVGHYMQDYVNAVREIGEWYGIPVLDVWANIGIQPMLTPHQMYMADGMYHYNALGHKRLAQLAASFLQQTCWYEYREESTEEPVDSVLFSDSFDRADNNADMGIDWIPRAGTWGIIDNQAYSVSDGSLNFTTTSQPVGKADYTITMAVTGDTSSYEDGSYRIPYVILRYTDNETYLHVDLIQDLLFLQKQDGSNMTEMVAVPTTGIPTTSGSWFNLKVVCNGANIKVYLNDNLYIDYTLQSGTEDKYLTGQYVGIGIDTSGSPTHPARIDNFLVESI